MRTPRRARPERETFILKMVPFIDMMSLLLIFFLLTIRYQQEGELEARTPKWGGARQALTQEEKELEIAKIYLLVTDGELSITLQGQYVPDFEELLTRLEQLPKDIPVIIDAQPSVAYKHVISAYNTCMKANLSKVAFAIRP